MNRIILMAFAIMVINGCSSKIEITLPAKPPADNETSDLIISEIATAINTDGNAGGSQKPLC